LSAADPVILAAWTLEDRLEWDRAHILDARLVRALAARRALIESIRPTGSTRRASAENTGRLQRHRDSAAIARILAGHSAGGAA
jgi:hypothetical protein